MIFLVYLVLLPVMIRDDPAPGLLHSKAWSRNLECERVAAETGWLRKPGEVKAPSSRGDYVERSAMICPERLVRLGTRPPGEDAILSSLRTLSDALALAARSRRPDLAPATWLVETNHPSTQVAAKVTFATKNALVGQGLAVSDRMPSLAAGDIDVITRMPPDDAYPAACVRYTANGSLREGDALLLVALLDPRETTLHAGICAAGSWSWLQ